MIDENALFVLEHRISVAQVAKRLLNQWIEVPEGEVSLGERVFHVGAFKISKSLVTVSQWSKVMGPENQLLRRPVTGVSFVETISFVTRLNMCWEEAGRISIPTEAQLMLARQKGVIGIHHRCSEICYTQYREFNDMGDHHFIDNIPTNEHCGVVIRGINERDSLPCESGIDSVGFRLVLVDYDKEWDVNAILAQFNNV
jgi:hypothetical protein